MKKQCLWYLHKGRWINPETIGSRATLLTRKTIFNNKKQIGEKKDIISFMRIKWSKFGLKFNLLHSKMLCAKFDWYWPSGSGVEDFFENVVNIFSILFPLRKRCGFFFMWTNLNSLIPFTQGLFVRRLVYIGLVFLEKVFKFYQFIFDISLLLGNGTRPFIWIHLIPFTQGAFCLCHVWLKLNQWFWRRRFLNIVKEF